MRLPEKPPVEVVTPVTSKSFWILTFFVVVIPVLESYVVHVPAAPAEMLTSIVVPLTLKVFPVPTKFNVSALPIAIPADWIPTLLVYVSPKLNALYATPSRTSPSCAPPFKTVKVAESDAV